MGYDVSYHPISPSQMHDWYFDILSDRSLIEKLKVLIPREQLEDESQREEFEKFYLEKYKGVLDVAEKAYASENSFDTSHGYYIAVIQGFFEEFFYTRGSAISFLEESNFTEDFYSFEKKYCKKWKGFIPEEFQAFDIKDSITTNYSSGLYIPAIKVVQLLEDFETDKDLNSVLNELFSHGRINVFLSALEYAKEKGLGLLEATEVIEPNPQNLDESNCYSNLFNCDPDGVVLFKEAVDLQVEEAQESEE